MDSNMIMNEPPEIASKIYEILSNFFFDLETYRAVSQYIGSLSINDIRRPLWIVFSNNCLMMAVVEWCKIFGSKKNNKTHYTHCIDHIDGIEEISNEMKEFRDKYISHYDYYDKPVPFLDEAVKIIAAFDQAMLEKYISNNTMPTATVIINYRIDIQKRLEAIINK